MGQEIFILATLPEQSQKIPLTGKVIWISHKQSGFKPQGFAFLVPSLPFVLMVRIGPHLAHIPYSLLAK
jgi:Tfp pilus assembly protein PilZ